MKLLVTGGAGFIGTHTVKELIKAGYKDILVLDNLSKGNKELVKPPARFVEGDLLDKEFINKLITEKKFDAVIHFAAFKEAGESVGNPGKYYENNIIGGINLLEAMVSGGVGKIIFSSSAAVYGEVKKVPITEEAETRPINPYGWTKLFFEQILKDYDAAGKLKYVALRYFNAGGADPEGELGNEYRGKKEDIISVVIESAQKGKEFKINGDDYPTKDGTCVRDMIHVTDLAKAHVAALNYLIIKMKSDYFNLGSEKGFSVKEIVNKTKEITKKDFKVTVGPSRPGDPAKVIASSLKAKQILGWEAEMTLEDIIMNAWDWEISQEAQQVQSFK